MVHEVFGVFLGKVIIQAIDFNGGGYRNRTGVHGFAMECILASYCFKVGIFIKCAVCV